MPRFLICKVFDRSGAAVLPDPVNVTIDEKFVGGFAEYSGTFPIPDASSIVPGGKYRLDPLDGSATMPIIVRRTPAASGRGTIVEFEDDA